MKKIKYMGKIYTLTKNPEQTYLVVEKLIDEINKKTDFLNWLREVNDPFDGDLILLTQAAIVNAEKTLLNYLEEK